MSDPEEELSMNDLFELSTSVNERRRLAALDMAIQMHIGALQAEGGEVRDGDIVDTARLYERYLKHG